jgi:hypothetical protein
MLSKEQLAVLSEVRNFSSKDVTVFLDAKELAALFCIACEDLGIQCEECDSCTEVASKPYFDIDITKVSCAASFDLEASLDILEKKHRDFFTYFTSLCRLHGRRRRYHEILRKQPFPGPDQILPRSLLEYGTAPSQALASYMVWRKFLYDLDNRAAQETGYLFEPILAAAIGGVPVSASKSPIKRVEDPKNGRQVDCLKGTDAYEFKLRVTIAASGQGRFGEELSFAQDCRASGFRPILLVLDPTHSEKLELLEAEYKKYSGLAFVGDEAWQHIERQSGKTLKVFIEKYVKNPITEVLENLDEKGLLPVEISKKDHTVIMRVGPSDYVIERSKNVDKDVQSELADFSI